MKLSNYSCFIMILTVFKQASSLLPKSSKLLFRPIQIQKYINRFTKMAQSVSDEQYRKAQQTSIKRIEDNIVLETGIFKTLPNVFTGPTHFKRAQRALKLVRGDTTIKNLRNRNRKLTAESLDTLMKGLTKPITNILDSYVNLLTTLHPYEAAVADLTIIARVKTGYPSLKVSYTDYISFLTLSKVLPINDYCYYVIAME